MPRLKDTTKWRRYEFSFNKQSNDLMTIYIMLQITQKLIYSPLLKLCNPNLLLSKSIQIWQFCFTILQDIIHSHDYYLVSSSITIYFTLINTNFLMCIMKNNIISFTNNYLTRNLRFVNYIVKKLLLQVNKSCSEPYLETINLE